MMYNVFMDLGTKNANNLISKDRSLSQKAAYDVINNKDIETFKKLCEKSDFIFDFIKEKIVNILTSAVTLENLDNTFEFSKIYSYDFEDFIVNSWLKFANENTTDKILDLFENGTKEQKAYAAKYFTTVNDSLCTEYLNKYAFDPFEPLAANCAAALHAFNDKTLYDESIKIINDPSKDDFEKTPHINFLSSYGNCDAFIPLYNCMLTSLAEENVASAILYFKTFENMIEDNEINYAKKIFDIVIGAYPETLSLSTVNDFQIFDFIKFLASQKDSYSKRLLLKAKHRFNTVAQEDIYTFDLDKNLKNSLSEINNCLNTLNLSFDGLREELESNDDTRIIEAMDVINNFALTGYADDIANYLNNNKLPLRVVCEGVKVLKSLNKISLVDKNTLLNIANDANIKALIESYFN